MNLLNDNQHVLKTGMTKKITINGKTQILPIYKVNLNVLFYNDQNDRIASWISQYKAENGEKSLEHLPKNEYNDIISKFIIASNEQSIQKTKTNISLVGQREPGVILSDGRIIDGNRRFTCLRLLNNDTKDDIWFETIILDIDLNNDRKAIKLMELSIQHGEEKKVDYNNIERLIGVYQDIVETNLLTIEEYAFSTNESIREVQRKVDSSVILIEFLDYIQQPKKYHIAREYQIVSIINDLMELLKKVNTNEEKVAIKKIVFLNIFLNTLGDGRVFIKNLTTMFMNGSINNYFKHLVELEKETFSLYNPSEYNTYTEIASFVRNLDTIRDDLVYYFNHSSDQAKKKELYKKPNQIVTKTYNQIRDIDLNLIDKMSISDKERMKESICKLDNLVNTIKKVINPLENINEVENCDTTKDLEEKISQGSIIPKQEGLNLIPSTYKDLIEIENIDKQVITSLIFKLNIRMLYYNSDNEYSFYFINKNNDICSNIVNTTLCSEYTELCFNLESNSSNEKSIYLVVKKKNDLENETRFLYEYPLNMSFSTSFEF